jgi:hypothetical protein
VVITQKALREYLAAAAEAARLKTQQAQAQMRADKLEVDILAQLTAGQRVQKGGLAAVVVKHTAPRRVGWKQAYVEACGEEAAAAVLAATPAKTSYSLEVIEGGIGGL